jgi:ATP-dependent exoDNAse (exonuclease V) beta subunit
MAVLRAVADPDDPVSLLAYRRSPAGGVPDTELATDAAGGGAAVPALAAADWRLKALRLDVERLPVDAAVRHVLETSGLVALSGLAFEAAQRVANLEKLALAASELARDGRRTLLETLDALEEGFESDEEGDSPLADTAALRSNRNVRHFTARMARFGPDELVRLDGPTFRNGAAIAASLDDARHEDAEDVRLLYVALTRARDRLIVFGGGTRKTAWSDALAAWNDGVTHRVAAEGTAEKRIDLEPAVGAPEAVVRFEAAAAAVRALADPPFRSPSDLGEGGEPASATGGALTPALAREVGNIVHARLAGMKTAGVGGPLDEADSILRAFAASPLAARMETLEILGREVPMLFGEDGARWQGAIDLLYRDDDGAIVLADYKTDASDDRAMARHGEQLGVYLRAVRRAMPGQRVRAELWMLRSGRVLEVE